jgi:hypothetical protein
VSVGVPVGEGVAEGGEGRVKGDGGGVDRWLPWSELGLGLIVGGRWSVVVDRSGGRLTASGVMRAGGSGRTNARTRWRTLGMSRLVAARTKTNAATIANLFKVHACF